MLSDVYDHLLMRCVVVKKSDNRQNHAFSLLIDKGDIDKVKLLNGFLDRNDRFGTILDIARIFPNAYVIDAFFRECGPISTVRSTCKKLMNYLSEEGLDSFNKFKLYYTRDTESRKNISKAVDLVDKIVIRIKRISVPISRSLEAMRTYYWERIRISKSQIIKKFPEIDWKDSGDCLFGVNFLSKLEPVCLELTAKKIEYFIASCYRFPEKHFLLLFSDTGYF